MQCRNPAKTAARLLLQMMQVQQLLGSISKAANAVAAANPATAATVRGDSMMQQLLKGRLQSLLVIQQT
jgi:hypothetical protein